MRLMRGSIRRSGYLVALLIVLSLSLVLSSCGHIMSPAGTDSTTIPGNTNTDSTSDPTVDPNGNGSTDSTTEPLPTPPLDGDLMAGIVPASFDGNLPAPDEAIAAAVMRYSGDLLLRSLDNDYNVMVSPASVFFALAMTMNGADKQTREDMISTLSEAGLTAEQINEFSRIWLSHLMSGGGDKTDISIANSIWFRNGFDADKDFLQTNADYYGAGARELDFAADESLEIINSWVNYNTNGLIDKIIEQISPTTVMYLINTVYFKSEWQQPFLHQDTRKFPFVTPQGEIEHDFMFSVGNQIYFELENARGLVKPYDDGRFAYVAVMPDEQTEVRAWLNEQSSEELFNNLYAAVNSAESVFMQLGLPKYEAEYEDSLNNELTDMGMGVAFDGGTADFSLLNAGRRQGLYISEVKHKTFIAVDEKGTEAAAATSVAVDESAPMVEQELYFDRPFFYAIIDTENGLPLFSGVLDNPAK